MKAGLVATAVAATATAVAACSSGGSPGTNGGGSTATPASMTTVTVGTTSGATAAYGPIYVGAQQGIFRKHGINLQIQTLNLTR